MLNEDQVEKIRQMLSMSAWREVVVPSLLTEREHLAKTALLLPNQRPKPYDGMTDEQALFTIRGEIRRIEWVLTSYSNEVKVFDVNRQRDELALASDGANP